MHAAMYRETEQESCTEVKNTVNSQRIVWFMQGIYYAWLTSIVLWMGCSNLHLMWKKMVSLLCKFLQACCKSGPHFKSVLKIVYRLPDSHDKIIYMIVYKWIQVWMLQYMVEPEISSLVLNLCSSVTRIQVAWQSLWWFRCLHFEPRKRKRLSHYRLLVRKFNICLHITSLCNATGILVPPNLQFVSSFRWLLH